MSSYAVEDGERLLLFDPIAPTPGEIDALAAGRETVIVLTNPWHERDARALVEGLGVPIYAPRADTAQDLMEKYGITAEQAGDGSPDLLWLRGTDAYDVRWYSAGDRLPVGIDAFAGKEKNDLVLWVESRRAVIAGDTLVDFGQGLEIPKQWLREGVTRERSSRACAAARAACRARARTHGGPADRAALERALAA